MVWLSRNRGINEGSEQTGEVSYIQIQKPFHQKKILGFPLIQSNLLPPEGNCWLLAALLLSVLCMTLVFFLCLPIWIIPLDSLFVDDHWVWVLSGSLNRLWVCPLVLIIQCPLCSTLTSVLLTRLGMLTFMLLPSSKWSLTHSTPTTPTKIAIIPITKTKNKQ